MHTHTLTDIQSYVFLLTLLALLNFIGLQSLQWCVPLQLWWNYYRIMHFDDIVVIYKERGRVNFVGIAKGTFNEQQNVLFSLRQSSLTFSLSLKLSTDVSLVLINIRQACCGIHFNDIHSEVVQLSFIESNKSWRTWRPNSKELCHRKQHKILLNNDFCKILFMYNYLCGRNFVGLWGERWFLVLSFRRTKKALSRTFFHLSLSDCEWHWWYEV